jgi:hypothetical protein
MRQDYLRNAGISFILFIIFFVIWFFFDPTDITLVIAGVLFIASIAYFIAGLATSPKPATRYTPPPQPQYQPAPTYQPQPSTQVLPNAPLCPSCGQPLTFLPDIKKWYCSNEKKIVTPNSPYSSGASSGQMVADQLAAERVELHKELHMLDERLIEGKISEATYKELKAKNEARLKEIE